MTEPLTGMLSPLEERFEAGRKRLGFWLAPMVFAALWFADFPSLSVPAHRLAAILGAVVVLWVTEALPMPMTAFLAAAGAVLLGVAPAKQVFAPFAEPLMFLFIGSFMLARAIFLHGLDRRLAFGVMSLRWVGTSPGRILFAYGAVTAFISAWISNTATTAMMYAIGLSIIGFLRERESVDPTRTDLERSATSRYATVLLLMTAFAASIGGLATPIGTPPNAIGLGFIRKELDIDIPFFDWMRIGVPVVVVLYAILFSFLWWFGARGLRPLVGSDELLRAESNKLGAWTTGQLSTLAAFVLMVALWITPGVVALVCGEASDSYKWLRDHLPEAVPALLGAGLLFLLPGNREGKAITWNDAAQIEWGVVFLYGGGFALGELARETGLAATIGQSLTAWLPGTSPLGLVIAATVVAVLVSEATSNTAAANIVIPVVIPLARSAGMDPLEPALAATMAASLGFMLPVSTPCNAIVYGSGLVPLTRMIRYGVLLDLAGMVTIIVLVSWLGEAVR
jgi:solute carrier family 13 (sodium-dependent dicarboxylate transporter), member 2/3/5